MGFLNTKEMVLKNIENPVVSKSGENGGANTAGLLIITVFVAATLFIATKYAARIREGERRIRSISVDNESNPALGNEDRPVYRIFTKKQR